MEVSTMFCKTWFWALSQHWHIPPYINRLVDLRYQVLPVELNSFEAQSWRILSSPSIFSFLAEGLYKCCVLYLEDFLFYLVNSQISFSAKVTSSMKPPLTLTWVQVPLLCMYFSLLALVTIVVWHLTVKFLSFLFILLKFKSRDHNVQVCALYWCTFFTYNSPSIDVCWVK